MASEHLLSWRQYLASGPSHWPRRQIGELFSERLEVNQIHLSLLAVTGDRGVIPRHEVGRRDSSNDDKSRYKRVAPGDIAYNTMRMWQGVSALSALEGIVSPAYTVLCPGVDAQSEFFRYLFKFKPLVDVFRAYSQGLVDDTLSLKYEALSRIEVRVPPIAEQRKIASVLSSVDEAIEAADAVIAQLEVVREAMIVELLTKGPPERHVRFASTALGDLPATWRCVRLGEALLRVESGSSPQCESRPAANGEWGVLKVSAVTWGTFRPEENKALPAHLVPRPDAEVHDGDVLLSRANTPELVGRSVFVEGNHPRRLLSDKILRLVPSPDAIRGRFLPLILSAPSARTQVQELATGSSRSMKNISQEKLRQVWIPLPPLDEQDTICAAVRGIVERLAREEEVKEHLLQLKSGLMSVLLTGELRVRPGGSSEAAA